MYDIDKEKFGTFLSQLRRERGMTQRELAEALYVSDKAVSKWERALSLPDISLLRPLAELFGVTVTELLMGERVAPDQSLTVAEVEPLVGGTLELRVEEREAQRESRRLWGKRLGLSLLAFAVEMRIAARFVPIFSDEAVMLWLVPFFGLFFGVYYAFFGVEKLPVFYDQYRLNFVSDGAFHLNVPGVRFNNNNWPHILNALRVWSCAVLAGWVPVYLVLWLALEWLEAPWMVVHIVTLLAGLTATLEGMFVPIYVVGRRYEQRC